MKIVVLISAVLLVIASILGFIIFSQKPSSQVDNSLVQKKELVTTSSANLKYVEYSKESYDKFSENRRVLFFFANWCPTCIPTDKDFRENVSKIPDDLTLIRVNYNDPETDSEEKELAKKYGITYQHTFVQIDKNGKEVAKWNGGKLDELLKNIK